MPDQQIDKPQAAVLVENAHGLWIHCQHFVLTHQAHRSQKQRWFKLLARVTLTASIVTVGISAFGFSQEPSASERSRPNTTDRTDPGKPAGNRQESQSANVIWIVTACCAAAAAGAKLGEQYIGRPEDIQSHSDAEHILTGKLDSVKLLVAKAMGYYDGTQPHDLQDLLRNYDALKAAVGTTGKFVGVTPDKAKEAEARDMIKGTTIDIALSRVKTPDEIPDNAAGIRAVVRGGAA